MRRVSLKLPEMDDEIAEDEFLLGLREQILNEEMLNCPEGIASRVHHALFERLRFEAPMLLVGMIANE